MIENFESRVVSRCPRRVPGRSRPATPDAASVARRRCELSELWLSSSWSDEDHCRTPCLRIDAGQLFDRRVGR